MLKLTQALRVAHPPAVAFVGAGGKTTAMFQLARQLAPALVTTSTHLGEWQVSRADNHFVWASSGSLPEMEAQLASGISLVTGPIDLKTRRFQGLSQLQLEKLKQLAGYHDLPLLIEADGSRQKPLKAPARHEPAIPAFVDLVVVLAGLAGLDRPLKAEYVHRPEIFGELCGLKEGALITPQALAKVLTHEQGGLKNIPPGARRVVLLNQADTPELQSSANEIGDLVLPRFQAAIVSALEQSPGNVFAVKENIAAIVLAAGGSSRYGSPKQLLDYHGKPFVRVVSETALHSGFSPVLVVIGSDGEAVSAALEGLPVRIIINADWPSGQSTSLIAGVRHLPENIGGAIFLLADQPQVGADLLRALVERHSQDLAPVLAPYVFDKRTNPTLFDRNTFKELLEITGDTGGRAIFSKFSPRYLTWYDKRLLLDVDTPEDYRKLINFEAGG